MLPFPVPTRHTVADHDPLKTLGHSKAFSLVSARVFGHSHSKVIHSEADVAVRKHDSRGPSNGTYDDQKSKIVGN